VLERGTKSNINFVFGTMVHTKMLKVEGLAYDVKRHQEGHKRCLVALGLKIFNIFLSVIGKYDEKDVVRCQKGPNKLLLKQ
jgi:hypothetical protein